MNTSELQDVLSATSPSPWKVGVFARDEIPKPPPKRKCLYICNTDSSHKPGSHWVVLCINGKGERLYFDAYGLPPMYIEFRQFLKNYVYNDVQLQEPFSTVCGHYCVLFSRYMFAGYSMEQIVCKLEPYTDADIERISLKKIKHSLNTVP